MSYTVWIKIENDQDPEDAAWAAFAWGDTRQEAWNQANAAIDILKTHTDFSPEWLDNDWEPSVG